MRRIVLLIFFVILLNACGNDNTDSETLLGKEHDKEKIVKLQESLQENKLVLGYKQNDKVKLNNLFKLGENTYFVLLLVEPIGKEQIIIELNKLNDKDDVWEKLSETPMPIKPDAIEIMNGIDGSIYRKAGSGVYKIVAKDGNNILAEGEFVVEDEA